MTRCQQISSASRQIFYSSSNLICHVFRGAVRKNMLRIDATPKTQLISVLPFQKCGIHVLSRQLDGVDDVHPQLDNIVKYRGNIPTTVKCQFRLCVLPYTCEESFPLRFNYVSESLRTYHQSLLTGDIIRKHHELDVFAHCFQEVPRNLYRQVRTPFVQSVRQCRVLREIHEPIVNIAAPVSLDTDLRYICRPRRTGSS